MLELLCSERRRRIKLLKGPRNSPVAWGSCSCNEAPGYEAHDAEQLLPILHSKANSTAGPPSLAIAAEMGFLLAEGWQVTGAAEAPLAEGEQ
jgi:hypothetical protein